MKYQEFGLTPALVPFLDCYWTLRTDIWSIPATRRVVPDICADIVINLGESVAIRNGEVHRLQPEKLYLVGTMTTFHEVILPPGANLFGIRFKPFGLSAILNIRQQGLSNAVLELDANLLPFNFDAYRSVSDEQARGMFLEELSNSLLRRMDGKDNSLVNGMIGTLLWTHGQSTVRQIADQYHTSERQLERKFAENLGVSLKEISNLIRFQYAYHLVGNRTQESLLDIAFQAGYYDHAHLTRHFKRYAGHPPSEFS